MKFNERIPKSPRELEIFYRDTVDKLKSTNATLEDVESLIWLLFSRSQQQGQGNEIQQLRDDMMTLFQFIPDNQETINAFSDALERMELKMAFLPNHQQEIHDIQRKIDDSTTLNLMRL